MEILYSSNASFTLLAATVAVGAVLITVSSRFRSQQQELQVYFWGKIEKALPGNATRLKELCPEMAPNSRRLGVEFAFHLALVFLLLGRILWAALTRPDISGWIWILDAVILLTFLTTFVGVWLMERSYAILRVRNRMLAALDDDSLSKMSPEELIYSSSQNPPDPD